MAIKNELRSTSRTRVLILTAGFGEGHNAAARALAEAFDEAVGPGCARVVDLFAMTTPRLNAVARRAYLRAINSTPRLWSRIYRWIDQGKVPPRRAWTLQPLAKQLQAILEEDSPVAVCSTYPSYPILLEKLRLDGHLDVPHFTIVTDSISINSLWWRASSSAWFLPNEDSLEVLVQAGIDPARLHATGFPVSSFFRRNAHKLSPPDLAAGAAPKVLYIANSGMLRAKTTARRLLAETDWEITCAVGRDENLRRELAELAQDRPRPATILGWTDQIPRLLMTHHALVSKAGGATIQEAIAALCPVIVNQVVPGQEEGNYYLLRRHGAGVRADTPDAVVSALRVAFAARGAVWRQWRKALTPLARPGAAQTIAQHVLAAARLPARKRSLAHGD